MPKGLTMTLEDCEAAISAIESGKLRATAEAIEVRAIAIARRCRAATWNIPSFRDKAEELARVRKTSCGNWRRYRQPETALPERLRWPAIPTF